MHTNTVETMKRIIFNIAVWVPAVIIAQTQSENYIKTTFYQTETRDGTQSQVSNNDKIVTVDYFDGIGRRKQAVAVRASGVSPIDHASQSITMKSLKNDHIIGSPVSKIVYQDGKQIQGQFMEYDTDGNVIGVYKHYKGKGSNTSDENYIPSDYELVQKFMLETGKPVQIQRIDDIPTSLLWDSTYTYVLAQLVGVSKTEMDTIIPETIDLKTKTAEQLRVLYKTLRNSFPTAQITSYTYQPLIGVTSVTDPKGYTMYYTYDDLNRLKTVKDQQDHILSENEYHYKNN